MTDDTRTLDEVLDDVAAALTEHRDEERRLRELHDAGAEPDSMSCGPEVLDTRIADLAGELCRALAGGLTDDTTTRAQAARNELLGRPRLVLLRRELFGVQSPPRGRQLLDELVARARRHGRPDPDDGGGEGGR